MKWLENERVRLRPLEPEDLSLLYRWENDPALWEYGDTLAPFSRYILKEYIAGSGRDIYESGQLRLLIEERASGSVIGIIDLFDFEPRPNRAACGILLDKGWQGVGWATEAMGLLIGYAFGFLHLHQLYAHIPVRNTASLKLFARCGFADAGLLCDWVMTPGGYMDVRVMQLLSTTVLSDPAH